MKNKHEYKQILKVLHRLKMEIKIILQTFYYDYIANFLKSDQ